MAAPFERRATQRERKSARRLSWHLWGGALRIFLFERLTVDDEFAALVRAGRPESHAALFGDDLDDLTARRDRVAGVHRFEETQRLRQRDPAGFLQQHPLVVRFAAAPPERGGGGVTVVELKD